MQELVKQDNCAVSEFQFGEFPIRVLTREGELWFVAADVCEVLGLTGYTSQHMKRLGKDEYQVLSRTQNTRHEIFNPKAPTATIITEPGLYKLVMRSDKPGARPFQDWVTRDVLPAIRKDGMYMKGEENIASGEMNEDELIFKAMGILQKKVERLTQEKNLAEKKLEKAKPAKEFVDRYVNAVTGQVKFREVCRALKVSERRFKKFLIGEGVIADQRGIYPYKNHIIQKRFVVDPGEKNGHAYMQTYFTPKGFEWVARKWAEKIGLQPVNEQLPLDIEGAA